MCPHGWWRNTIGGPLGCGEVLITPLHEHHDRGEQVSAGGGQPVLVTVGIPRVRHLFQQPVFDEGA